MFFSIRVYQIAVTLLLLSGIETFAEEAVTLRPVDKFMGTEKVATNAVQNKIVGGEVAYSGEFPFQVALISANTPSGYEQLGQFCGGSLVSSNWVLTAAHCVPNTQPYEIIVYVGASVLPYGDVGASEGKRIGVEEIISHQQYDSFTMNNDIALLKLKEEAPATLRHATLGSRDQMKTAFGSGKPLTVIGWGYTVENGSTVSELRKVDVNFQDRAVCEANYSSVIDRLPGNGSSVITGNMFCAGNLSGGVDSCQGDSGGFLGAKDKSGDYWIQYGIVSWGIGCARPDLFGVYTQISNYDDWLNAVQERFRN